MPKLVFATVGTSAIENCLQAWDGNPDFSPQTKTEFIADELAKNETSVREKLLMKAPAGPDQQAESVYYQLKGALRHFNTSIGSANMISKGREVSAEVASLLVMSREPYVNGFGKGDEIWLIPSDTKIGVLCADVNRMVLDEHFGEEVKVECTKPLKGVRFVAEPGMEDELIKTFRSTGLQRFEEEIKSKKTAFVQNNPDEKNNKYIIDVTGGFKGLIIYAPILCARYLNILYYYYHEATRPISVTSVYFKERNLNSSISISDPGLPATGDK